jgi:hypothetical protein
MALLSFGIGWGMIPKSGYKTIEGGLVRWIVGVMLGCMMVWGDSFITQQEYARMLYQNPRGVGCHKCHGSDGKGRELGRYREANTTKVIFAPDITQVDYERFAKALRARRRSLMPTYFLSDQEIKTLYNYLHGRER